MKVESNFIRRENMINMKFHWEKQDKEGVFIVSSYNVEDCIKLAEEEISNFGAELIDWYVI